MSEVTYELVVECLDGEIDIYGPVTTEDNTYWLFVEQDEQGRIAIVVEEADGDFTIALYPPGVVRCSYVQFPDE